MSRPLDIADIVVRENDRLRPLDQAHVDLIADSMARQKEAGLRPQIAPIEVSRSGDKFVLVAGWHRLAAAKKIGLTKIEAEVIDASEDARRLREIEENVCRHNLNPLDWAFSVQNWFKLQGALVAPRTKAKTEKTLVDQCWAKMSQRGFSEAAGQRIDVSPRSIRRALLIAEALKPVRRELAGLPTPLNQSELLRLAREPVKKRVAIIEQLRAGKTLAEATVAKRNAATKAAKALDPIMAAWNDLKVADQDAFLRVVIKKLTAKRRIQLGDWMVTNGIVPKGRDQ